MTRDEYLEKVKWRRSDLSFFLVHLTKDDPKTKTDANMALDLILSPDDSGLCTLKGNPQGLFGKVEKVPKGLIKAVSLTEAPLDQIKHFAEPIPGDDSRNYSKYGLVFDQDFIRREGGNPCFYLNTLYSDNLKKAALHLVDCVRFDENPDCLQLLRFFSIFGRTGAEKKKREIDFYWEREWRVPGDLKFRHSDVFVGLCDHTEIKTYSSRYDIPFICPDWNYDRILETLRNWHPKESLDVLGFY
jgi:hypothetical protein